MDFKEIIASLIFDSINDVQIDKDEIKQYIEIPKEMVILLFLVLDLQKVWKWLQTLLQKI